MCLNKCSCLTHDRRIRKYYFATTKVKKKVSCMIRINKLPSKRVARLRECLCATCHKGRGLCVTWYREHGGRQYFGWFRRGGATGFIGQCDVIKGNAVAHASRLQSFKHHLQTSDIMAVKHTADQDQ